MGESAAPFGESDTRRPARKKIFELTTASPADFFTHISSRLVLSNVWVYTWRGNNNSIPGLEGYGGYTWLLVGVAGIPSSILWMRLAHRYGSLPMIVTAMLVQVVGILLPTLTRNPALNLLSGILYGGTFVGLVALFLNLGGRRAGANPVVLMGALTSAYGIGQVAAPLYSVALTQHFGSYDPALYLTAAITTLGALLMLYGRRFDAS